MRAPIPILFSPSPPPVPSVFSIAYHFRQFLGGTSSPSSSHSDADGPSSRSTYEPPGNDVYCGFSVDIGMIFKKDKLPREAWGW